MSRKVVFALALLGLVGAVLTAWLFGGKWAALPPAFAPSENPFGHGIYATGIVESDQASGTNVNIYPDVAGRVVGVYVAEGQSVKKGDPLFRIDDSVERPTAEQHRAQADAALAALERLRAQPRPEDLEVARARLGLARANVVTAQDRYRRLEEAGTVESRAAIEDARNELDAAIADERVAERQLALVEAGSWSFDIEVQEREYQALARQAEASEALLARYLVRAPVDGVVLRLDVAVGTYVSPQGAYQPYTQGLGPAVVMGSPERYLAVRCYIDEILVHRLPPGPKVRATMSVRGTALRVPLEYVRTVPYVTPKIQLSDQRTERVDVRVLPVIFRFEKAAARLYPGQLVDVYVEASPAPAGTAAP